MKSRNRQLPWSSPQGLRGPGGAFLLRLERLACDFLSATTVLSLSLSLSGTRPAAAMAADSDLAPSTRLLYEKLLSREDCKIMAHAGAGKSSCLFAAWAAYEEQRRRAGEDPRVAWVVLYNKHMQEDGQRKAHRERCEHIAVYTFDALIKRFYEPASPSMRFEVAMHRVVAEERAPLEALAFDVLVIDEAQDMDDLKWDFARMLRRQATAADGGGGGPSPGRWPQLVLIGDPKQTIYSHRGARASILVDECCSLISLSKSYRCSPQICAFINARCRPLFPLEVWREDVQSARQGHADDELRVWHFSGRDAKASSMLDHLAKRYAELCHRAAAEGKRVAVLSHSVRPNNHLLWCVMEVAQQRYEAPRLTRHAVAGHPLLCTVHSTKGCEFWATFVFVNTQRLGLQRLRHPWRDPELIYTGFTRASHVLHIIQDTDCFEAPWCRKQGVAYRHSGSSPASPQVRELVGTLPATPFTGSRPRDFAGTVTAALGLSDVESLFGAVEVLAIEDYDYPIEECLDEEKKVLVKALELRVSHLLFGEPLPLGFDVSSPELWPQNLRSSLEQDLRRRVVLLPVALEALERLRDAGPDAAAWRMQHWYDMASLVHPDYHFGHVAAPPLAEEDLRLAEQLFGRFKLQYPQHLRQLRRLPCDDDKGSLTALGSLTMRALLDKQERPRGLLDVTAPVITSNGEVATNLNHICEAIAMQVLHGADKVDIVRVQGPVRVVRVRARSPARLLEAAMSKAKAPSSADQAEAANPDASMKRKCSGF